MKIWLGWVMFAGCCGGAQAQTICDRIKTMVADPSVASAHWGVSVTTLDGVVVCAVHDAQTFRPASNNKIFTSAAAMAVFGPDKRFTTTVMAEGDLKAGVLTGDLKLVGGGDANFGSHNTPYVPPSLRPKNPVPEPQAIADIEELAAKVVATGLKRVDGDVVGDDRLYAWQPYPPDWTIDDAVYGYGAPVSALTVHDSEILVEVAAGGPQDLRARIKMTPGLAYYAVDNTTGVGTPEGGCDGSLGFERGLGSKLLSVYGVVPLSTATGKPCRQAVAIQDPAEYGAQALKAALERRGVKIRGVARASHHVLHDGAPLLRDKAGPDARPYFTQKLEPGCSAQQGASGTAERPVVPLASHQSPVFGDDLVYTLKVSQNLHAEMMLRNLAVATGCERDQQAGLQVVRQFLDFAGVQDGDYELFDGSGLSAHDLVAPRAFTTFLRFASTQPWFAQWKAALPEGGVDGTLNGRFAKTLGARVSAKTGTLSQTRALSGYAVDGGGKTMVFSVMVDTHLPMAGADRVTMDKIVEAIASGK